MLQLRPHLQKSPDGVRPLRLVNMHIWDSCLAFENFVFKGPVRAVNPRNPFEQVTDKMVVNYDLDSEDELQELMGEDAEDDYESDDSEA